MIYSEHKEKLDLVKRTHAIFCGIKGKDISLVGSDPPGKTDCESYIAVPMEDPDVDLIHKHEWQHLFFKTNLRARAGFVAKYVENLSARTADRLNGDELEKFLHTLANALDDLRVSSLWHLIYPQSAEDIRGRWRRILRDHRNKNDLISFVMCVALDVPFESNYEQYRPVIQHAVGLVDRAGFASVLLATRYLVDGMLQALGGPQPGPAPADAPPAPRMSMPMVRRRSHVQENSPVQERTLNQQARLLNGLSTNRTAFGFNDTPKMPVGPDPNPQETNRMVQTALSVTQDHQVRVLLERSSVEVEGVITTFRNLVTSLTPDERLLNGLEGEVRFRDLQRSVLEPTVLEPQDLRLVSALKQRFSRLINMKATRRTDAGSVLNPTAYIEFLMGSGDSEFFEDEESSRGFSALILVDMSGSMREKWRAVSRACKVTAQATRFPFSQREVWGFSSSHKGEVVLFRFDDLEWGYIGPGVRRDEAWGLTPLHLAIPVAVRRLKQMPGSVQHLFIITDGYPTHMGKSRRVLSPEDLIPEVSRQVREARRKNVNVVSLVVGNDIKDEKADVMFGGRNHWSRVRPQQEDLFVEMVGLVDKAFTRYLRTR